MTEDVTLSADRAVEDRSLVSGSRWLTFATVVVGAVNYLYSLVLTRLLEVDGYATFAAGQALLLIAGTVASASVPWVLAKQLAASGDDPHERQRAVWFATVANLVQGTVAGIVVAVLGSRFADPATTTWLTVGAVTIFLASTTIGWLQGEARFGSIAKARVGEVGAKVLAGLALVWAGAGAAGAIAGFAVGAALVVVGGLVVARDDLRPRFEAMRSPELWRSARGVIGIQGFVAVLASADLVIIAMLPAAPDAAASYQVSMILARVPLFLAGAVSMVAFPLLSRPGTSFGHLVNASVRMYGTLTITVALILATAPAAIIELMFPRYPFVKQLLTYTVVAGVGFGLANLLSTYFQAHGSYRRSMTYQAAGLGAHGIALTTGWILGGVTGYAIGSATGAVIASGLLLWAAGRTWPGAVAVSPLWIIGGPIVGFALWGLSSHVVGWLLLAVPVGLLATFLSLGRRVGSPQRTGDRTRILHLGFEDHRRPGSGGGSHRTHEVNRRLADRYDITVVTAGWPGAEDRVEDGVRYVHAGLGVGYAPSILSYFMAIPFVLRRHDADLIVEDFAAPISSALAPLWTDRPVVALVQWLNAREKSRQYKLPFFLIEEVGVRMHDRFLVVSEDLGGRIREMNPDARIDVVGNGVDPAAFAVTSEPSDQVVFLGRLEMAQKGVDLLLEAFSRIVDEVCSDLVLIGEGPDRRRLERTAERLGISQRVRFVGRLEGTEKFRALASAAVVAMPSRFETFGIVAAEAMACGTPVVAFEIPCLRSVVGPDAGILVEPFDVTAFAEGLRGLLQDRERREEMGRAGRRHARRFDWDEVAARQGAVYEAVLSDEARR